MDVTTLNTGEVVRVAGFARGDRAARERLLTMGLTPGTEFEVARIAPLGDPVEIRLRGFSLSLRRAEVALLNIERIS